MVHRECRGVTEAYRITLHLKNHRSPELHHIVNPWQHKPRFYIETYWKLHNRHTL